MKTTPQRSSCHLSLTPAAAVVSELATDLPDSRLLTPLAATRGAAEKRATSRERDMPKRLVSRDCGVLGKCVSRDRGVPNVRVSHDRSGPISGH